MKHIKRSVSLLLLVALLTALFAGVTFQASAKNTNKRDTLCTSLSTMAKAYYTGAYTYDKLSALAGGNTDCVASMNSALYKSLQKLMSSTQTDSVSYKSLTKYWPTTDNNILFYADQTGSNYNREHVWPKSRASFYQKNGGCDLHHLRPANQTVNSTRYNYTMGYVNGVINGCSTASYGGRTVLWYSAGNDLVEVRDNVKGDVARILLYVYCRWGQPNLYQNVAEKDLPDFDSDDDANNGLKVIESLDTLLKWCKSDPVDTWEMSRNDEVQNVQGNRNVFIDYPEYAWLVFGQDIPNDMKTPSGEAAHAAPACDHVWDAGKVTTEPTCTAAGVKTYTCSKCGNTKTEELPALGHIDENKDELCDRCGAKLGEDPKPTGNKYVKAASLKDGDEVVLFNPAQGMALSEEIVATYYKVGTAVTPTDGVLETSDTAIVWTVAADGTGFNLINDEGKKLSIEGTFSSIPYDKENDAWTVQTAATVGCVYVVNENGKYISWSSKGNFAAYTFDAAKEADYALELYVKTADAPHVHTWDEGKVTTEPTCTKAGVKTYTCTVCKETKTEAIAALGHKWDDGKVTTEPTCTEAGVKTYTCTVCKETKTEAVAALGHVDADKDNKCDRCGEKLGEDPKPTYSDFTDLDPNGWYHDGVNYMIENGMMNGVGNGMFEPNGSVTRAMLVTILYRQAGSPSVEGKTNPFIDVKPNKYYTNAVIWAFQNGIVNGTTPTTFEPEEPVTREQIATILYRQAGSPAVTETDLSRFLDASDVSSYATNAVRWAVSEGVIKGSTVVTAEQLYTAALNELDQNLSTYSYHFADLNGDGFPALIANVPDFTVGTNYWMFFDVFNGEFVSLGYMEVDGQAQEEGFFVTDAGVLYYLDRRSDSSFEIYRIDQKADGSLDMKLVTDDYAYDETFVGEPAASYLESVGAHKLDTYYKQGGVPESFRDIKLLALYPKDTATRAEIATMLMRYLTK